MKKQKRCANSFLIVNLLLIISVVLGVAQPVITNALPGPSYRYSVTSCSTSDSACIDNSAQAGVYRIFRGTLNRNPDNNGYSYWSNSIINGNTLRNMATSILNSSEWKNKYSGLSNTQFLSQTYQFILYRSPDPDGYNYWLGQLNGGRSRGDMVATMATSTEAMNKNRAGFVAFYQPSTPTTPTTPTPTTPSNPTPTPTPNPTPRPVQPGRTSPQPTASRTTPAGLAISDLSVSNITYNTATVTWKTNKPADSKINYSTNKDDLFNEQRSEARTTNHTLELTKDNLKAGQQYFFRVTSSDDSGPATMDSEFGTLGITVIISVTDEEGVPINQATVTIEDESKTTLEDGTASFVLPEGTITIVAEKDDLRQKVSEELRAPDTDAPVQISLALGEGVSVASTNDDRSSSQRSLAWLWALLVVIGISAIVGFIIWRKRRSSGSSTVDPLEADNYSQPEPLPIPDTPLPQVTATTDWTPSQITTKDPAYAPLEQQHSPHHATLPELVGRYGTAHAKEEDNASTLQQNNNAASSDHTQHTAKAVSSTGIAIPKHNSLKDLVDLPQNKSKDALDKPSSKDLPVSPLEEPRHKKKSSTHGHDDSLLKIEH